MLIATCWQEKTVVKCICPKAEQASEQKSSQSSSVVLKRTQGVSPVLRFWLFLKQSSWLFMSVLSYIDLTPVSAAISRQGGLTDGYVRQAALNHYLQYRLLYEYDGDCCWVLSLLGFLHNQRYLLMLCRGGIFQNHHLMKPYIAKTKLPLPITSRRCLCLLFYCHSVSPSLEAHHAVHSYMQCLPLHVPMCHTNIRYLAGIAVTVHG